MHLSSIYEIVSKTEFIIIVIFISYCTNPLGRMIILLLATL